MPDRSLMPDGNRYHIGAIIITLCKDQRARYDGYGVSSRCTNPGSRYGLGASSDAKTCMQQTEVENKPPKLPLLRKVEALSIRKLARQIKKSEQTRQTKQSKQSHPVGISFSLVGQKGNRPTCRACGQQIERGVNRLALREIANVVKRWSSCAHYHLNSSCVVAVPPEYQAQVERAPEYQEQLAFEVDSHSE